MFNISKKSKRWNDEAFLNLVCTEIACHIDWDSIDSGRLHNSSCKANILNGKEIIVAVFDRISVLEEILIDVESERKAENIPDAQLWVYVPESLTIDKSKFQNAIFYSV